MKESDMDLRVASWLFRNLGSVINKRGDNGNTLLHEAASANDVVLIEFLIKKGADLEILNDNGYTPLKKAFMRGNMDAFKMLLENGANPTAMDFAGWTLLHAAVCCNEYEAAQMLLKKGADPEAKTIKDGKTVMELASNDKMIKMILAAIKKKHNQSKNSACSGMVRGLSK